MKEYSLREIGWDWFALNEIVDGVIVDVIYGIIPKRNCYLTGVAE